MLFLNQILNKFLPFKNLNKKEIEHELDFEGVSTILENKNIFTIIENGKEIMTLEKPFIKDLDYCKKYYIQAMMFDDLLYKSTVDYLKVWTTI